MRIIKATVEKIEDFRKDEMKEALKRAESFARQGESYTDVWKAIKKIS